MKRLNALGALCAHLYDRYLRGVCWSQMGRTLVAFSTLTGALLLHVGVPVETATRVTTVLTLLAAFIYLIIPKSRQALADNLLADAVTHQAQAMEVADKVALAVGIRAGTTASKASESAPPTILPPTTEPTSQPEGPEGQGSDDATKPQ